HLPDDRHSQLANVFQNRLAIPVKEADDKESIVPGTLYVAPAGYHVSVESDFSLSLSQEDKVFYSRPSIDILFGSAADAYAPRLAGAHQLRQVEIFGVTRQGHARHFIDPHAQQLRSGA
ncbi:protein-glutamate methylesterase, partial [Pseudomonas syringae pv. pisi str. 1704B]